MATPFSVSGQTDTSSARGVALHDGTQPGSTVASGVLLIALSLFTRDGMIALFALIPYAAIGYTLCEVL